MHNRGVNDCLKSTYDEIKLCVKWGYEEVTEPGKEKNSLVSNNIFPIKLYNTAFRSCKKRKVPHAQIKGTHASNA
jgi:hypothetical protein